MFKNIGKEVHPAFQTKHIFCQAISYSVFKVSRLIIVQWSIIDIRIPEVKLIPGKLQVLVLRVYSVDIHHTWVCVIYSPKDLTMYNCL